LSEENNFLAAHEDKEAAVIQLRQQFNERQAVLLSQIEDLKKTCAEYRTDAERLRRWRRIRQKIAPEGGIRHLTLVVIRGLFEHYRRNSNALPSNSKVVVRCDQPDLSTSGKLSGISCLQGWAWPREIVERIEILIDGTHLGDAFYGFVRPDVIQYQSNWGDDVHLGFAFRLDTSILSAGKHQLKVVAIAKNGQIASVEGGIEVVVQQKNQNLPFAYNSRNGGSNGDGHLASSVTSADETPFEESK